MLAAACPGAVFTSPTPDQMFEGDHAVNGGAGVVHIVKNYTGDVMNFDLAAELARAEGITVEEAVLVNDDVAVEDSLYTAGRRGRRQHRTGRKAVWGSRGAGRPLNQVVAVFNKVKNGGRSMGMALTSCTVPHVGKPTFDLPEDEMEIGIEYRWRTWSQPHESQAGG